MASCALQRQSVVRIHIAAAPYQILRICCTDAAIMVNWQCILLHRPMAHARHAVHRLAGMPMSPFPCTQEGMADTIYSGYMAESAPPLAVVQAVLAQSLPASGATLPILHMHQCLLNHAPFAARSSQPAAGLDAALGRAFNMTGNANCEQPSSAVCLQPHNQTVELGAAPLLNTAPLLGREQLLGGAPSLGGALLQGGVPLLGRSSLLAESPLSGRQVLPDGSSPPSRSPLPDGLPMHSGSPLLDGALPQDRALLPDGSLPLGGAQGMPEHSIQCPHCSESLTAAAMGAHMGLCPQQPMMCTYCHMALTQSTLTAHEACCDMRPVLCLHCAATFTVAHVDVHAATCDARMVSCQHCSLKFKASVLSAHEASMCPLRPERVSIFDDFSGHNYTGHDHTGHNSYIGHGCVGTVRFSTGSLTALKKKERRSTDEVQPLWCAVSCIRDRGA